MSSPALSWFTPVRAAWSLILVCMVVLAIRYPAHAYLQMGWIPRDFNVYLLGSSRSQAHQTPYVASDETPYKYSPGALAPFRALPQDPRQAWIIFSALCILAFGATLLTGARYQSWKSVGFLALGLGLAWKGIIETLDQGQMELLLLILAVAAAALQRRQPLLAGLMAGTLPWFKLPWALLVFPLILVPAASLSGPGRKERRVRVLLSGYLFAWFLWGAAIPSLMFGSEHAMQLSREWLQILHAQPADLFYSPYNQGLWISVLRWVHGNALLGAGLAAVASGGLLGAAAARSLKQPPNREVFAWVSPWLLLVQLLNPLSWRWGSVFLVGIPFAIATSPHRHFTRPRMILWILVAGTWLLQLNPVAQMLGYTHWTDFHAMGVITIHWLALLLLTL